MTAVLTRPGRLSEPEPETPDPPTPETYTIGRLIVPGGKVIEWDTRDSKTVAVAKAAFDTMVAEGGLTYKTEGSESETIRTFDPEAHTIVASRQMAGG